MSIPTKEQKEVPLSMVDRRQLTKRMPWANRTTWESKPVTEQGCGRACNHGEIPDEKFELLSSNPINEALRQSSLVSDVARSDQGHRWLFETLLDAGMNHSSCNMFQRGLEWFVLRGTHSLPWPLCTAAELVLESLEGHLAHAGLSAVADWVRKRYSGAKVGSIQINFHPEGQSCHPYHQDRPESGPLCRNGGYFGTACFSLGSTRAFRCQAIRCRRTEDVFLKSGCGLFFNSNWNDTHVHAVPPCSCLIDDRQTFAGPRISICFFLYRNDSSLPCPQKALAPASASEAQVARMEQEADKLPPQSPNPDDSGRLHFPETRRNLLAKIDTHDSLKTPVILPKIKDNLSASRGKLPRARSFSSIAGKSLARTITPTSSLAGLSRSSSEGRILAAVAGLDDLQTMLQAKLGQHGGSRKFRL